MADYTLVSDNHAKPYPVRMICLYEYFNQNNAIQVMFTASDSRDPMFNETANHTDR